LFCSYGILQNRGRSFDAKTLAYAGFADEAQAIKNALTQALPKAAMALQADF